MARSKLGLHVQARERDLAYERLIWADEVDSQQHGVDIRRRILNSRELRRPARRGRASRRKGVNRGRNSGSRQRVLGRHRCWHAGCLAGGR